MTTTVPLEARGIHEPYVGPRPLKDGEALFGRATDCDSLLSLLNSERIVLLHAPSGAGKSSLLNAGIIHKLRESYFAPLGPITLGRLGSVTPNDQGQRSNAPTTLVNRVLLSLNAALDKGKRCPEDRLSQLTLLQFYKSYISAAKPKGEERQTPELFPVIIFDQFEEIFDDGFDESAAEANRRQLFQQLRELLLLNEVFALFSMREDFLGRIEPRSGFCPGNLRARYRLDLLGHDQALEAIYKPFARYYGKYEISTDGSATWADLLVERLQQSRDVISGKYKRGQYIEPVLLQVVCRYIWNVSRRSQAQAPTEQNFVATAMHAVAQDKNRGGEETGVFDDAIGGFYKDVIRTASGVDALEEPRIRDWIGTKLISEHMRSQANFGPTRSQRDVEILDVLQNEHLIRQDTRGDTTWYELVHDRLVEPILESNRQWELSLPESERFLKVSANRWKDHSFSNTYLLRGRALNDATAWASQQSSSVTDIEATFLKASRRERFWIQVRKFSSVVVVLGVLGLSYFTMRYTKLASDVKSQAEQVARAKLIAAAEAEAAAKEHDVNTTLAVSVENQKTSNDITQRRLAMEMERVRTDEKKELALKLQNAEIDARQKATDTALGEEQKQLDASQLDLVQSVNQLRVSEAEVGALNAQGNVRLLASDAIRRIDGNTRSKTVALITALEGMAQKYSVIDTYAMSQLPALLQASLIFRAIPQSGAGLSVAYRSKSQELVVALPDGIIARANIKSGGFFDRRFLRLCIQDKKGTLFVLPDTDAAFSTLNSCDSADVPSSVAISPDGESILAGFASGEIFLWSWNAERAVAIPAKHRHDVTDAVFDHSGDAAVSVSALGAFSVTRLRPTMKHVYHHPAWIGWYKILVLNRRTEFVNTTAFVGDAPELLAIGLEDGGLELWSANRSERRSAPEPTKTGGILSISSNTAGTQLALTGNNPGIELWTVVKKGDGSIGLLPNNSNPATQDKFSRLTFHSASSIAYCSAFRPDGKVVVAGQANGRLSLWNTNTGSQIVDFPGHQGRVNSVIFLGNGYMASTGEDASTRVWQVPSEEHLRTLKEIREAINGYLPPEVPFAGPPLKLSEESKARWLNLLGEAAAFLPASPDVNQMP
jgi:WD40 repeat protein